MPLIGLRNALATKSVKVVPLKELPIITEWNLVYPQGKRMTPAQQALIDHINLYKNEIASEHFDWAKMPFD